MSDREPANALPSGVDPLTDAIDATLAKMSADADRAEQLLRRDRDIWALYHTDNPADRLTPARMEAAFRRLWMARGLPEDEFRGAGLSQHSIRKIVEGPKP